MVRMHWSIKIPLRDGVRLSATLYIAEEQRDPAPALFTLTPYTRQTYHDHAVYFAAKGLPFLTVDVRGRGDSEGEFTPYLNEAKDGHDVVEWLAKQPFCNGKVSMWGGSYAGYDQWMTAKERPPALAAIVPVASPYFGVDFPIRNNIASPYWMQWLTLVSDRTSQDRVFADQAFWIQQYRRWFESGAPFAALDGLIGNPSAIFREWVAHPRRDSYWAGYNPTPAEYAGIDLPVLTITGSYDGDQLGALMHFREHSKYASAEARQRHYLIIGPWDHAGTRVPRAEVGGLEFGPASLLDLHRLHLEWYVWTMQSGPKPAFLRDNVAYYVTGSERWSYANSLEAITERSVPFFLDSRANPTDMFAAGTLKQSQPTGNAADQYVYDPADVSHAGPESEIGLDRWVIEQRLAHLLAGRQLYYHTEPFSEDVEISGFFRFEVWMSIDRPDTDFSVCIHAIDDSGVVVLLTSDALRARYREGLHEQKLIDTQEPLHYDFDGFTFVSRLIRKGHRLRLTVGPVNSILMQRNFNAGGVVAEESIRDAVPVTVRLFHDAAHPSALHVPFASKDLLWT